MDTTNKNKKDRNKSHIPFRLNLLFFIIFLLFVTLIIGLGYLQIIKGEEYKAEVERTESTIVRGNVPRGEIYDSKLRPLVANEAKNSIMYTRGSNTKNENMAEVASNLAHLIDMPHTSPFESDDSDLTIRDLKDYFYALNTEMMEERVKEYADENDINTNNISYSDSLELISDAEVMEFTENDLKAAAIFTKMNSAYALSTVNIKSEDVSLDEIAKVSENLALLPGVSTGTDWNRLYPQEDTMRSILGSVSSEEQGLPESELNTYLAKGYSRNDRVGRSLLEAQYEDVLRGSKSSSRTETDNSGDIISQEEIFAGNKGNNLVLTIDMDFQDNVDDIVLEALSRREGLSNGVYAVALDPNNGEVLALSGKRIEDGKVVDDTLGTLSNSFVMGSSIKAATVLAGYMDGVITTTDNVIVDRPLSFQGSQNISSIFNRSGSITMNDISALQRSSNIYMSTLAMRMGGYYNYEPNSSLPINAEETIEKMRGYYRQFGLGSETGIDLPNESAGQPGNVSNPGEALFFSFGQFDTYTPLQLAQYATTVANGGTRYAPRLVSEIRGTDPVTGEVGALVQEVEPKVMNHIDVSDEEMDRVQRGLYEVINTPNGTGYSAFTGTSYTAAGKTGTAQANYWGDNVERRGEKTTNTTFIAYAPHDDPEIAVAVVIPYLPLNNFRHDNSWVARQMLDAYFGEGNYSDQTPTDDEISDDIEAEE